MSPFTITFIRPNMFDRRSSDAMEPLCFAILKSLTPRDVETKFYDERLEPIPFDEPTDLVAMTVETYTARRAYQIAAEYRSRGVRVVMGGYHPSFLPEEALQFADAVVVGDAEGIWPHVVDDVRCDVLQEIYRQDDFPSLERSCPDRSIFRGKRYAPITMLQYARGCKYNCDFCSIRAFYGSNLRQRPVGEVVAEIQRVGRKHIFIVDDNIFVDIPKAKELFAALTPLNIRWSCQVSIDITKDNELVELMRCSGCTTAVVGFESLNPDNLSQMNKSWNLRYGDYESSIKVLQDAGVMIYGTFVFGYDEDTVESFDEAVEFAIRNRFYLANFNPLTPTPRAPLMDRLRNEGRLIHDKWWLDPSYRYGHATFHPRRMSAQELTAGCYRARSQFNRYGSIARRTFDRRTNLRSPYRFGLYLLSNMVSRREIHSKQDMKLGGDAPLRAKNPEAWNGARDKDGPFTLGVGRP
ncbi:MAG: B12-binding domain-containing radical SAM protein [Planctomycetales bacterium]|nr:B12-binding domain-containing radical SAM protein [Planctomycetales bacterium]